MEIQVLPTRDCELLAALNEEVQNLHVALHPEMFKPHNKAAMVNAYQKFLADDSYKAYVAWKDQVAVGCALFTIRHVEENAFHYAISSLYVDQICVLKQHQNLGVGDLLLRQAEQLAKELSIKKLELDHWTMNTHAAAYFRKKGYKLFKERLYKFI